MPKVNVSPKNFPELAIPLLEVDSMRYPFFYSEDVIRNMSEVTCWDDDVMICGYMRSGTHWCYEILNMLLNKSTETVPHTKHDLHVEKVNSKTLEARTSPRVFNGHMQFCRLPKQVMEKRVKVIYLLRDPRDVAVSWYQLMEKNFRYRGGLTICPFPDWLKLFMDGELEWGSWFDHVKSWEQAMLQHQHHPILVVHYEDLISDPRGEIIRMNRFLGMDADDEFCGQVAAACHISNMKKNKYNITEVLNGESVNYNKGQVGSWRAWFTREMSDHFNQVYHKKMRYSRFHSKYIRGGGVA
ncbi:sulfotransferase 1B1-like [Haliotis rufescens]|uniref:sulfotransferase 1B1-like n=1 Tax=Haliotis rufescens TaxID=6454 RepID=UPI001EAFA291|nr:sulfotransferase 1B1-like [Haliotis rufescens]